MLYFKENCCVTPNDDGIMGKSDSESINNAIRAAGKNGRVLIPRHNKRAGGFAWSIDDTILLPSDIEIILDNCYMRQADGVMTNMFRNKNMYSDAGVQKNIKIIGVGNTTLDGGKQNGLLELNSGKNGMPHIRNNNIILFHNVKDFVIENLKIINQRWWAINLMFSSFGRVSDIDFYVKNEVPNEDGIDLRMGCNNILIENITGQAGDDLVALTALKGDLALYPKGADIDIHDIKIRNILGTSVRQALVALRNQDDSELYNILIENVIDNGNNDPRNMPYGVIRIGENLYIKEKPSPIGSTRNITVRGVISKNRDTIVLGATLKNSSFSNIHARGRAKRVFSTDTKPYFIWDGQRGVKIENVSINGVYYSADTLSGCIFFFEGMREEDYAKSFKAKNVFADCVCTVAHLAGNMELELENVKIERTLGEEYVCGDNAVVRKGGAV